MLLPLGRADDAEIEELFAEAEAAEARGPLRRGGGALPALPRPRPARRGRRLQPRQLPADGRAASDEAAHAYAPAIKLDPSFVEAWFNFAGLLRERGQVDAARAASAARRSRSTPTMPTPIYNLAALEFDAGNLARGAALVGALSRARPALGLGAHGARAASSCRSTCNSQTPGRLTDVDKFLFDGPEDAPHHHPAGAWRRRADGFGRP